ncbi:MAG: SemiSWEET transporter [Burkholderiaceae bacterium]|nr:SemiSWEET transporter [Burkholderiaceae bacterium]
MTAFSAALAAYVDPALLAGLRESVGLLAACLTTLSFVPQAWHTLRTRDVSGISLTMYSVFTAGVALWLLYGLLLGAWPVIVANVVTLALAATILTMKLRFGRSEAPPQR